MGKQKVAGNGDGNGNDDASWPVSAKALSDPKKRVDEKLRQQQQQQQQNKDVHQEAANALSVDEHAQKIVDRVVENAKKKAEDVAKKVLEEATIKADLIVQKALDQTNINIINNNNNRRQEQRQSENVQT